MLIKSLSIFLFIFTVASCQAYPVFQDDYRKNEVIWGSFQIANHPGQDGIIVQEVLISKNDKPLSRFTFEQSDSYFSSTFLNENSMIIATHKKTYIFDVMNPNINRAFDDRYEYNIYDGKLIFISRKHGETSFVSLKAMMSASPELITKFDSNLVNKTLYSNHNNNFLIFNGSPVFAFQELGTKLIKKLDLKSGEVTELYNLESDYSFVFSKMTGNIMYLDKVSKQELYAYDLDKNTLSLVCKVPGKVYLCESVGDDELVIITDNGRRSFPYGNVITEEYFLDGSQIYYVNADLVSRRVFVVSKGTRN